jgi:hypothetical protein
MFEIEIFNNAFNGGKAIRNPSFLLVPKKWSRFDALVILPAHHILLFIESKVGSDGTHGASGHETIQPIRNLEAAFFLTTLPESQYRGWDFRYLLLCPKSADGKRKQCEEFFLGGYGDELDRYDNHLLNENTAVCAERAGYTKPWQQIRPLIKDRLAVVYWSQMMDALCKAGFDRNVYLQKLSFIDASIAEATKRRWIAAGIAE